MAMHEGRQRRSFDAIAEHAGTINRRERPQGLIVCTRIAKKWPPEHNREHNCGLVAIAAGNIRGVPAAGALQCLRALIVWAPVWHREYRLAINRARKCGLDRSNAIQLLYTMQGCNTHVNIAEARNKHVRQKIATINQTVVQCHAKHHHQHWQRYILIQTGLTRIYRIDLAVSSSILQRCDVKQAG